MSASNLPSLQPSSSSSQTPDLEADWYLIKPSSDKPQPNRDTPPSIPSVFGAIDETQSGHSSANVHQWNQSELRTLTQRDLDVDLLFYITKRIFHKDDLHKNGPIKNYYLKQIEDYGIALRGNENRIENHLKKCNKTTISFHHFLPKEERDLVEQHVYNLINKKTFRALDAYKSYQRDRLVDIVTTIAIENFSSRELSDLNKAERAIIVFSNAALYLRAVNSLPVISKKFNLYKAAIELNRINNGGVINPAAQIAGLDAIGPKSNVSEIWVRSVIEYSLLPSLNVSSSDDYDLPNYNNGTPTLRLKEKSKNVNLYKSPKSYFFYLKKFFPDQANRIIETFVTKINSPLNSRIKSLRIKNNEGLRIATGGYYNELSEITTNTQLFNSCGDFEKVLQHCDLQEHYLEWKGMIAKPRSVQPLERDTLE